MPTLRQKSRTTLNLVGDLRELMLRAQSGDSDYYWESDPVKPVDAASTHALTNDDLKPNDELNLIRKKRRRGLTIPMAENGITNLATMLGSIGINIPS